MIGIHAISVPTSPGGKSSFGYGCFYESNRFPHLRPLSFDRDGLVGSALHMAVLQRDAEAVNWLLQLGLNPNEVTSNCETALHLGVASGDVAIVSSLIGGGAYLNAVDEDGDTALHWAVREGSVPVAQRLLAERACGALDIDATNADGDTPLHLSCSLGDADMAKLLLEHGANPNISNSSHYTALDEALANGHSSLVPLLQNFHAKHAARYTFGAAAFGASPLIAAGQEGVVAAAAVPGTADAAAASTALNTATAAAATMVAIAGSPFATTGSLLVSKCGNDLEQLSLVAPVTNQKAFV